MKKMEKILSIINKAKDESFWIGKIEKISLQNFLSADYKKSTNVKAYYEIRFYVDEEKLLKDYDVDTDTVLEAIDYFLIPNLRKDFITEIKEVNYLYDDVEIVIVCEDVL